MDYIIIEENIKMFAKENAKQLENFIVLELQKGIIEEKEGKIVWTQKAKLKIQDKEEWKEQLIAKILPLIPEELVRG